MKTKVLRLLYLYLALIFLEGNIYAQANLVNNPSFTQFDKAKFLDLPDPYNVTRDGFYILNEIIPFWYNPDVTYKKTNVNFCKYDNWYGCPNPYMVRDSAFVISASDSFNLLLWDDLIQDDNCWYRRALGTGSCSSIFDKNLLKTRRSYVTNQLRQKLIVGKHYRVSFYITNRPFEDTVFNNMPTPNVTQQMLCNGIGVAFSVNMPVQKYAQVLNIKPMGQIQSIIVDKWIKYTFEFVADSAYQYMTIGNFNQNKDISFIETVWSPLDLAAYNYSKYVVNPAQSGYTPRFSLDSFSLIQINKAPEITGNSIVCRNSVQKYKSGTGFPTKWFFKGNPNAFYTGDSVTLKLTSDTVLVALSDGYYDTFAVKVLDKPNLCLRDTFAFVNHSVTVTYPFAGLKYVWDNIPKDSFQSKTYTTKGLKSVKVSNQACTAIDSFKITYIDPYFKINTDTLVCQYTLHSVSTTKGFRNYSWKLGSADYGSSRSQDITYSQPGNITIEACYDTLGYTFCDTAEVKVLEVPKSDLIKTVAFCAGLSQQICPDIIPASSQFTWNDGVTDKCRTISSNVRLVLKMTNVICSSLDTVTATVKALPGFKIFQRDTSCLDGEHSSILAITPDTFPLIAWYPDNVSAREISIKDTTGRLIKITGSNGCSAFSFYSPQSNCDMKFYVPDVFSPNGDGTNDIFRIEGIAIGKMTMYVYNSWGELIFRTEDLDNGWNGLYRGSICPQGYYLVRIELKSKPVLNRAMPVSVWNGMVLLLR